MHSLPQSSIPWAASITVEVPFGQLMQALFRSSEEYVPIGHRKHFSTPVEEKKPGPQLSKISQNNWKKLVMLRTSYPSELSKLEF